MMTYPRLMAALADARAAVAARDHDALMAAADDALAADLVEHLLDDRGQRHIDRWNGRHATDVAAFADMAGLAALGGVGGSFLGRLRERPTRWGPHFYRLGPLVDAAEAAQGVLDAAGFGRDSRLAVTLDLLPECGDYLCARLAAGEWRRLGGSPATSGTNGKEYRVFERALAAFAQDDQIAEATAALARISPVLGYALWVEAASRGHKPPPAYRF